MGLFRFFAAPVTHRFCGRGLSWNGFKDGFSYASEGEKTEQGVSGTSSRSRHLNLVAVSFSRRNQIDDRQHHDRFVRTDVPLLLIHPHRGQLIHIVMHTPSPCVSKHWKNCTGFFQPLKKETPSFTDADIHFDLYWRGFVGISPIKERGPEFNPTLLRPERLSSGKNKPFGRRRGPLVRCAPFVPSSFRASSLFKVIGSPYRMHRGRAIIDSEVQVRLAVKKGYLARQNRGRTGRRTESERRISGENAEEQQSLSGIGHGDKMETPYI